MCVIQYKMNFCINALSLIYHIFVHVLYLLD